MSGTIGVPQTLTHHHTLPAQYCPGTLFMPRGSSQEVLLHQAVSSLEAGDLSNSALHPSIQHRVRHCSSKECFQLQVREIPTNNDLNHKNIYCFRNKSSSRLEEGDPAVSSRTSAPGIRPCSQPQDGSRIRVAVPATSHHILLTLLRQCTRQEGSQLKGCSILPGRKSFPEFPADITLTSFARAAPLLD